MTKTNRFTFWGEGNGITNVDFVIGNEHTVDEQLNQVSLLFKTSLSKTLLTTGAKVANRASQLFELVVMFALQNELFL